jgi:hypothetical protein
MSAAGAQGASRAEAALRYWEAKRGDRVMPAPAEIRLHEIAAALPIMLLLDVTAEPIDFLVRFCGVGLRLRFGTDPTGGSIAALPALAPGTRFWAGCVAAVRERRAHFLEAPCRGPGGAAAIAQELAMPLSADGVTVSGIFAVMDLVEAGPAMRIACG